MGRPGYTKFRTLPECQPLAKPSSPRWTRGYNRLPPLQLADAHRSIAKLEARLADSANAKHEVTNRRLLVKVRYRIRYPQHRLRRRDPHIGSIVPVSDRLDVSLAESWLRGACASVEYVDVQTGEVLCTWHF